jgi:hypothetical protein
MIESIIKLTIAVICFCVMLMLVSMAPIAKAAKIDRLLILSETGAWSTCYLSKWHHNHKSEILKITVLGDRCFSKKMGVRPVPIKPFKPIIRRRRK